MAGYSVNHQKDFIKIPISDVCVHEVDTGWLYIQPYNLEAVNKIIEQCLDIKAAMTEEGLR